jgi:hypothetical protein
MAVHPALEEVSIGDGRLVFVSTRQTAKAHTSIR